MINANGAVLDRAKDENIQNILKRYSYYVEQVVNFGTHLLLWEGDDSQSELTILKLMLRYFLDMLDALSILIRAGSGEASKSLLRSAFELNMSMHFIYSKHTRERADAFLIVDKFDRLKELEKLNSESLPYKQTKAEFIKEGIIKDFDGKIDSQLIKRQIQTIEEELKNSDYRGIVNEYERVKLLKKKQKKIYWYELFEGVDSIESMAKSLNKHTFYEVLYRKWSKTVHGNEIIKNKIHTDSNGISDLVPIRLPVGLALIAKFACGFAINTFGNYVINSYPTRFEEYEKWEKEFTDNYV
jgi:hypothetical protein